LCNLTGEWQRYADESLDFRSSAPKRLANVVTCFYLNRAFSYYSHEVAHNYFCARKGTSSFRVDWSDWSNLVPEYIHSDWSINWEDADFEAYLRGDKQVIIKMKKMMLLSSQSGLYQQKFNAIKATRYSVLSGQIGLNSSASYLVNQFEEPLYILLSNMSPTCEVSEQGYFVRYKVNDVSGYIEYMKDLGIKISLNEWLAASFISTFLSGSSNTQDKGR